MTSLIIEEGHIDISIILMNGNSSTTTLTRYHNTQDMEGLCQQKILFQTKSDIDSNNDNITICQKQKTNMNIHEAVNMQ